MRQDHLYYKIIMIWGKKKSKAKQCGPEALWLTALMPALWRKKAGVREIQARPSYILKCSLKKTSKKPDSELIQALGAWP